VNPIAFIDLLGGKSGSQMAQFRLCWFRISDRAAAIRVKSVSQWKLFHS